MVRQDRVDRPLVEDAQRLRHEAARIATDGIADSLLAIQIYRDVLQVDAGDAVALDETLRAFEAIAVELRQPFFEWMASAYRGMYTLLDGRVADAERLHRRRPVRSNDRNYIHLEGFEIGADEPIRAIVAID